MIPIKDYNPTRKRPLVTWAILVACIAIYFVIQPTGKATFGSSDPQNQQVEDIRFTLETAAIPCEVIEGRPLTHDEVEDTFVGQDMSACQDEPAGPAGFPGKNVYLAVLFSMFLHGGLLHLGGNMLYLFIFGNNIEERLGHLKYAAFYLASGIVATFAHIALDPRSTVPIVGASGAIAGVMGAYAVTYPRVRIRTVIIFFFLLIRDIPAAVLLGIWLVTQFFISPGSGVAWAAHVGGFVFGALFGLVWRVISPPPAPARAWGYEPVG